MLSPFLRNQVQIDEAGAIAQDLHCVECEYNLRSMAIDGVCPECGKPVETSIKAMQLRLAQPRWLKQVTEGVGNLVLGLILAAVSILLYVIAGDDAPGLTLLSALLGFCAVACFVRGNMLVTDYEPRAVVPEGALSPRSLAAKLNVAPVWTVFVAVFLILTLRPSNVVAGCLVYGSIFLPPIFGIACLVFYGRRLALRIPDRRLARWSLVVAAAFAMTSVPFLVMRTSLVDHIIDVHYAQPWQYSVGNAQQAATTARISGQPTSASTIMPPKPAPMQFWERHGSAIDTTITIAWLTALAGLMTIGVIYYRTLRRQFRLGQDDPDNWRWV